MPRDALVVLATARETELWAQEITTHSEFARLDSVTWKSPDGDHLRVLTSGVGKANAAMATALALAGSSPLPRVVFSTGCAGAFATAKLNLGDVVVADPTREEAQPIELLEGEGPVVAEGVAVPRRAPISLCE